MIWLVDATAPVWLPPHALRTRSGGVIAVLNKIDVAPDAEGLQHRIAISARTGQGMERLIEALHQAAALATEAGVGSPLMTRARHRVELEGVRDALRRFGHQSLSPELKAEELRIAARHLGRLTGRIDVEEVLGAIFAEFCIGK